MSETVLLDRVLSLPAIDIAALLRGQLIAVLPKVPIQKGWSFLLYPYAENSHGVSIQQQYRSHSLALAQATLAQHQSQSIALEAWARCEDCKMLHDVEQINTLSSLTIWAKEALQKTLEQRQHVFLAFLRVYRMPELIRVERDIVPCEKFDKFAGLPVLGEQFSKPLKITQLLPVLSDSVFEQRSQQLKELRPPLHLELEELQSTIAQHFPAHPKAQLLIDDIKIFLGWADFQSSRLLDPDLHWIQTIACTGNSAEGHEFEKLVRKSLIKLGFSNSLNNPKASLDPEATGGAGGIDFYCNVPYQLVGECKATQSEKIPSRTPGQLIQLGKNHLQDDYDRSIKLIVAAGELTHDAKLTAQNNQMNMMRPETLQRLVELKAKYPGSIDLLNLKPCLESAPFGEGSNTKINNYIDAVWQGLKVRSHLIEAVKQLADTEPDRKEFEVTEIRTLYNARFREIDGQALDNASVHEFLIELSSPLAGYLGRRKVTGVSSDRFYYLRHLVIH
jgi:hypothetical protein